MIQIHDLLNNNLFTFFIGKLTPDDLIEEDAYVTQDNNVVLGSDLNKPVQIADGHKIILNMAVRSKLKKFITKK